MLSKIDKVLLWWCPLPARGVRSRLRNRMECVLFWRQVQEQENEQTTGRQEKYFRRRVPGVREEVKELPEHSRIGLAFFFFFVTAEGQCRHSHFGHHQHWVPVPHTSCLSPSGNPSWTMRQPAPLLSCEDGMASPLSLSRPSLGATLSRAGVLKQTFRA